MPKLVWLIGLAVLVVGGAGLAIAASNGWLDPTFAWVRQHLGGKSSTATTEQAGMTMPGMDMSSMKGNKGTPSAAVRGHAEVILPGNVQQRLGLTFGTVEEAPLTMTIRAVGIVRPNETKVSQVHLRTEGWVGKVFINYTGQVVEKGAPLLDIYSPGFLTTQDEYLTELQGSTNGKEKPGSMAALARRRLELWGVPDEEIEEIKRNGKPHTYLTLRSPQAGTILVKNAFPVQYVTPKTDLYTVADLSTVWVQAEVYEYELPHVELGQPASVTLAALPGQTLPGKVVFVQPTVDEKTRTAQVRIELKNKKGLLRPGMFAQIVLQHDMGRGLFVPASAILRTGTRNLAYREETAARFVPVEVTISPLRFEGRYQVLSGQLKAGDRVVTSADFLIDSESRLDAKGMANMPGMSKSSDAEKDQMKMHH
jgi:Cu(I)/Ag(I) efflux system membrane fusion protein